LPHYFVTFSQQGLVPQASQAYALTSVRAFLFSIPHHISAYAMNASTLFPPLGWGTTAKVLRGIIVAEIVLLWAVGILSYRLLPETVPLHFDETGSPTSYGSKATLLVIPFAFMIAPLLVLIVAEFRFVLLQRVPYLVNLPAVFTRIGELAPHQRSQWINRYFERMLEMGVALGAYLLILELVAVHSMATRMLSGWTIVCIVGFPLLIVAAFFYRLKQLSAALARELPPNDHHLRIRS
jgi:uncharacterized membrane protein